MKKNLVLYGIILAALVAGGAVFYHMSRQNKTAMMEEPAEEDKLAGEEESGAGDDTYTPSLDISEGGGGTQDPGAEGTPGAAAAAHGGAQNHGLDDPELADASKMAKEFRDTMAKATEEAYEEVFEKLGLDETGRRKLTDILVENQELYQELIFSMLDSELKDEDILKRQAELAKVQDAKLGALLHADQIATLEKYDQKLPAKMMEAKIDSFLQEVKMEPAASEKVKEVWLENEVAMASKMEKKFPRPGTRINAFNKENLGGFRDMMRGVSNNDFSSITPTYEDIIKLNNKVLAEADKQKVSKESRAALKDRLDMQAKILESAISVVKEINKDEGGDN